MKINVGDYELVYSTMVIQIKDNPITIVLPDEIEGDFKFEFRFITDNVDKEMKTRIVVPDIFTCQFEFVNFDGSLSGNNELQPTGTLRHIPLFLNYRVLELDGVGKTLLVNFYTRKEEVDGQ